MTAWTQSRRGWNSAAQCGIVGINIGANKDSGDRVADYRTAFVRLAPLAGYVVVNVSSPNTPGLRDLQRRDELERLLDALADERARHEHRNAAAAEDRARSRRVRSR